MPHMVCCKKTWSVGSDDFVMSSILGIIFRLIWLGGLITFTIVVLVVRDCFSEETVKKIVFTFIFSQIGIQACVLVSEALIGFISSRGTINNAHPRRHLPHFLRLRAFLYFVEVLGIAFGGYVAWSPYIRDNIECNREDRVKQALEAYVISVIVVLAIIGILFMIYFDPLGLQTPSLLTELRISHNDEDETDHDVVVEVKKVCRKRIGGKTIKVDANKVGKRLYSSSAWKHWTRRVRALCCCIGGGNNRSKVQALEDIAHAMATMFDGVDVVLSDFVAALMLVHRDQKKQLQSIHCDLGAQLRNITYDHMDDNQFTPGYEKHAGHKKIDFYLPDVRILMRDIRHYLKFALGIYGWPIHVYLNPLVGTACLCAHLKCRAIHRRGSDFAHDNCCLANTAALQLRSNVDNDDVIYVSYENEVHLPPFSLCFDHPNKAVVLSIRGSMSLRDALTDMNMSMKSIVVEEEEYRTRVTKVHAGMYRAANRVMLVADDKLEELFASEEYKDYKLIITGHSLGAGVGAILAVLYRSKYRNLHCYSFSPPGSLFTLPLVEYSKSFITTIIYGNDIVPRLTFRGLLYLKRNMTHLVHQCKLPKVTVTLPSPTQQRNDIYANNPMVEFISARAGLAIIHSLHLHAILCPTLFSCCYRKHRDHHHKKEFKSTDLYNHSTEEGFLKTPVLSSHGMPLQQNTPQRNDFHVANVTESVQLARKFGRLWKEKAKESTLHHFVEKMYTVEQAPAFVPGRVLYIRETGKRIRRRFWNIFGEKEIYAVWKPNEEFCHIIVDNGMLDHHLPDSVLSAVERLCNQHITGKDKLPEAAPTQQVDATVMRSRTYGAGTPIARPKQKVLPIKSVPALRFTRQDTEPSCRVENDNTRAAEDGSIVSSHNQVEVVIHIPSDNGTLVANGKEEKGTAL